MLNVAVIGTRGFPGVQGGIETHCEKLYPYLVERGCVVSVVTRVPYVDERIREYKGVSLIPVRAPKNKYLEAFFHTFKGLMVVRKLKPDILHIHAIGPSVFAPLARLLGMKVVVTTQGPDYKRKKWPFLAQAFLRFCEFVGVKYSNEIIAVSNSIANEIKRKYGRQPIIIPNGVEVYESAQTDEILRKLQLQRKQYVLAVGRFVPEKGFHDLIDAFNLLQGESIYCNSQKAGNMALSDNWKLVIAGDADHEDKYSSDLKMKANKSKHVILPGFLKGQQLHELYSHAGLFVISSYHEGLPLVLLEGMSYGLSCIASDIPANKHAGLSDDRYFEPGNIREIAAKICEFINKPFGESDSKEQINAINDKYNWRKIAENTLNVYRSVI